MAYTVTFWGTRASIPPPGPHTARYGGNTPCVAVEDAAGRLVILDAGAGIEDDQPTCGVLHGHTGRVAAVASGVRAGGRDGGPRSPERHRVGHGPRQIGRASCRERV